ncbi:LRR receptor-like serine/threonine-protein kinase GSO1 [Primulina tabacum]|uniref:LRR receptor-like serine/threonine-protein kinase GSO1 n=1 Tax=Primulina tabacum TaxID=48773 RepID=UPI003F59B61C
MKGEGEKSWEEPVIWTLLTLPVLLKHKGDPYLITLLRVDWLHKKPVNEKKKILEWDARLKIAVGLSQGLEYLHHDCVPKILHRDVKSSNILLDADMEAHLGDFGLAKTLADHYDSLNTESNLWFVGSYGYIAPEYAYSMKATEKSDVYSIGVVLMELVTGRMPTDGGFGEDMDMVSWVESCMESSTEELIDPLLKPLLPNEEKAMFQMLEIALQCTKAAPAEGHHPVKPAIS